MTTGKLDWDGYDKLFIWKNYCHESELNTSYKVALH